ncbi:hypothetical protein [Okeania sp. SIO3I5]|nr:hypothetical protein [Okeania sp. SIO3I5]
MVSKPNRISRHKCHAHLDLYPSLDAIFKQSPNVKFWERLSSKIL